MTKDEALGVIRRCAQELGRAPTRIHLQQHAGLSPAMVRKLFGSHLEAHRQAGLQATGPGYLVTVEALLTDWATITRQEGKIPTRAEYDSEGRFSSTTFEDRWGTWSAVPSTFRDFVRKKADASTWQDVLQIIEENSHRAKPRLRPYTRNDSREFRMCRFLYATSMRDGPCNGPQIIFPGWRMNR